LPDTIPTHWNIKGEIDGYGPKATLFLMPGIMVGMILMFAALPAVSPKPFEIDGKQPVYLFMMLVIVGLMGYIHALLMWAAMSPKIDISRALVGGIMLMMALMGNVMGKIKRNLYMGIRTPWTLANDRVWADTHRVGAWWLVGAGLLGFVLSLMALPVWVPLIPLAPAIIWPILYSYLHFKKLEREGGLGGEDKPQIAS
jgi:uncharacterized membrane protein